MLYLALALITLVATALSQNTTASPPLHLNITALSTRNMSSIMQCWQLSAPLTTTSTPGTSGALNLLLSNATNTSYTVIPARFNGGMHTAPAHQWVVFLSGLAHITLPNATGPDTEAWVTGGKYGVIFAADTADVSRHGHVTEYPGAEDTVTLQIPVGGPDGVPEHEVLYEGACRWGELVGV